MAFINIDAADEDGATKRIALWAIVAITAGLAVFNVGGAIAGSKGDGWLWIIRVALALVIAGAEVLAAVALVRVMLAPNWLRRIVGALIALGIAWACIQNGKKSAHEIFPDVFAEDASFLEAKAELDGKRAETTGAAASAALAATADELKLVRSQIAALEVERTKMAAQSPEGIKEAQAILLSAGKYYGRIDGIRENLTEAAMRGRGEEISRELAVLKAREAGLVDGTGNAAQTASDDAALAQIENENKAKQAREAAIWIEVMLWVLEGARSFGLWVFVSGVTADSVMRRRALQENIELANLEQKLGTASRPVEPEPEPAAPEPVAPAPEPVLTKEQQRSQNGGKAAAYAKAAAAAILKIPVGDHTRRADRAEPIQRAAE